MAARGRATHLPAPRRRQPGASGRPAAIDLAERLRRTQRTIRSRVEGRAPLLAMVRAVSNTLQPTEIAELMIQHAANWIPAHSWAVVSGDASSQPQSMLASRMLDDLMAAVAQQVGGWVIRHGEDFIAADLRDDTRVSTRAAVTALGFPLTSRSHQIGALVAVDAAPSVREPRLSPGTRKAMGEILEAAAVGLDRVLLWRRAEALSVTDDLTHLYNARYLNQVLRSETKRAARNGKPLSLLFVDLDGFKSVNDSHGHLSGSRALVEAAAVIRGSARETDIAARFGGDEFALILPDTGGLGALSVAERVRDRIARHAFLTRDGLNIHLTASVGVATLPDAAVSAEELVQAADAAMYHVKGCGKNGIHAAGSRADK